MDILECSAQHVHCSLEFNSKIVLVTICYGDNSFIGRRALWGSLSAIASRVWPPWNVMGDFNAVIWTNEKDGGCSPSLQAMQEFNNYIGNCALQELHLEGPTHTWSNSNSSLTQIFCRLDRALVNNDCVFSQLATSKDHLFLLVCLTTGRLLSL